MRWAGQGRQKITNASNHWYNSATAARGTVYTGTFLPAIDAAFDARNEVSYVIWGLGESLDTVGEESEDHEAALRAIFEFMRADIGSHLKIFIQPLSRRTTGGTDAGAQIVRAAQQAIVSDTDYVYMLPETAPLALDADGLHLASASFDVQAPLNAKRIASVMGWKSGESIGPSISSAQLVGDHCYCGFNAYRRQRFHTDYWY